MKTSQATRARGPRQSESLNALLDRGAVYATSGQLDDARAVYRQAEAISPGDIRAPYSLAVLDLRDGRFEEARRRLKSVLRREPAFFNAQHNLGVVEQTLGHWQSAAEAYQRALNADPKATLTRRSLAIALAVIGRTDDAVANYRRLADDPDHRADALARLAILKPQAIDHQEFADLGAYAMDPRSSAQARLGPLFALATVRESLGQFDAAFDAFAAGNALKRRLLAGGPPEHRPDIVARAHQQSIDRVRSIFTAEFLAEHRGGGDLKTRPIFIVGMPRSGSSLVEQILASHPQVQGMGESDSLWRVTEGRFPYPPDATRNRGHFRDLARFYLARQRVRGFKSENRLTDKTLDNHLHVGLIRLMFPRAVIVHVTRNPVDTGLACFRQLFATGNETLYDLADIADEWWRYRTVMDHWRLVAPGAVMEVSYEAITRDPETQIRHIVTDICGLTWSEDCLRYHETSRPVATASASQVRQLISRSSVDRWRRYATRLTPLLEAMDDRNRLIPTE